MDLKLSGKTVLVTGASRGIGFAIAQQLAAEGVDLKLTARDPDALASAAEQLRAEYSVHVEIEACDLKDRGAAERLKNRFPNVDILVNNAGDIPAGYIEDVEEEAWRAGWDAKVFGYINLSRAYYRDFREKAAGTIVNILGIAGEMRDAGYIAGSTGNAALIAFTKALGSASPQHGVRVVGISPGPVATDRLEKIQKRKAMARTGDESQWKEAFAAFPFGRAASPDEIAAAVAFLASPLSAYTSGAILTIDGGISAGRAIP
ncbi:short-chain dehydrogenase/reductase [Paraburkholderia sp. J63]|uniref:short-chain dehydrogenase/reductase n=1 Tax=Paraburkholderia sp. J63 TaxID=2805434 RepID=UPI002ABE7786|nr:short-chain dehydrogenase/reductase [Paraburkholderia sp. J63]